VNGEKELKPKERGSTADQEKKRGERKKKKGLGQPKSFNLTHKLSGVLWEGGEEEFSGKGRVAVSALINILFRSR